MRRSMTLFGLVLSCVPVVVGCGEIQLVNGAYRCSPEAWGDCPSGWVCRWSEEHAEPRCFTEQEIRCGDGAIQTGEQCDDGNVEEGDGCDHRCTVELGYTCNGPGACTALCGDQIILGDEDCDGFNLGGNTCEGLLLGAGALACGASCRFDLSGCTGPRCGNEVVEGTEECDGENLNGHTCETRGFTGGVLACTTTCSFNTSGCDFIYCGDGSIDGGEECDDGNHSSGDGCSATCMSEAGWTCTGEPSVCVTLCGNGALDSGEQCEGTDLGGMTCDTLGVGFIGGVLACTGSCVFDTSACELPTCGNGAIDAGEQCDGVLLGGQTCVTVGAFVGGSLTCAPQCAFDTSSCLPILCGDGILSLGEACDDVNQQGGDGSGVSSSPTLEAS